jgi:hypothetical protein
LIEIITEVFKRTIWGLGRRCPVVDERTYPISEFVLFSTLVAPDVSFTKNKIKRESTKIK